jgi:hypothetical protein
LDSRRSSHSAAMCAPHRQFPLTQAPMSNNLLC